jgi:hypothetical protein
MGRGRHRCSGWLRRICWQTGSRWCTARC